MLASQSLRQAKLIGQRRFLSSSLVTKFDESISKLPMREAVRYKNKNLKWTAEEFKKYSESHANALLEHEFKKSDSLAVWLPESAEKHVVWIAAAKTGMRIFDIDTNLNSVSEIREWLKISNCKAIYFDPVDENHNKLLLLRKAIPEFFHYDDSNGQSFHSKYFPNLKYFIQTGFDVELGCLNFKSLFLPHPFESEVQKVATTLSDDLPLYTSIKKGSKGVEVGPTVTQSQVLQSATWDFANKIINKEYFEAN